MSWLPNVLIIGGGLISSAGGVSSVFAYLRFFRTKKTWPDKRARVLASLDFTFSGALSAVIAMAGIQLLLVGLVLGNYIQASGTIFAPAVLVLSGIYGAWWSHQLKARLNRSL